MTASPVPPLPPVPGVDDDDLRPGGRSVLTLLGADHRHLLALCESAAAGSVSVGGGSGAANGGSAPVDEPTAEVGTAAGGGDTAGGVSAAGGCREPAPGPDRPALADPQSTGQAIVAELCRHLSAEAQYGYPAVRRTRPEAEALVEQVRAEDAEILITLTRLEGSGAAEERQQILEQLTGLLRRHSRRFDRQLAPLLRQACSEAQLIRLGNRVEIAKEAAPTRPHPELQTTSPANRIVDPVVGVADKVRDLLTARTTWSQDL